MKKILLAFIPFFALFSAGSFATVISCPVSLNSNSHMVKSTASVSISKHPLKFIEAKWFNKDPYQPDPGTMDCVYSTKSGEKIALEFTSPAGTPFITSPYGDNWHQATGIPYMICKENNPAYCQFII